MRIGLRLERLVLAGSCEHLCPCQVQLYLLGVQQVVDAKVQQTPEHVENPAHPKPGTHESDQELTFEVEPDHCREASRHDDVNGGEQKGQRQGDNSGRENWKLSGAKVPVNYAQAAGQNNTKQRPKTTQQDGLTDIHVSRSGNGYCNHGDPQPASTLAEPEQMVTTGADLDTGHATYHELFRK